MPTLNIVVPLYTIDFWYDGEIPLFKEMDFLHLHKCRNNFRATKHDCWIATYPKSGTTILQYIVHLLKTQDKASFMRNFLFVESQTNALDPPCDDSGRILKTHLQYDSLPCSQNDAPILFCIRDPRDVVFSYWHFLRNNRRYTFGRNLDFDDFFERFISGSLPYGGYEEHLRSYMNAPGVALFSYEDLLEDPISQIYRIGEIIGIKVDQELVVWIAEQIKFDEMKEYVTHLSEWPNELFPNFFRVGKSRQWQDKLTETQLSRMAPHISAYMEITSPISPTAMR
jgi:hypothetical protein